MRAVLALLVFVAIHACAAAQPERYDLVDPERARLVPAEVDFPSDPGRCTASHQCPVALLSHGYGMLAREYSFVTGYLNAHGYLVVGITHQLKQDPPMDPAGDLAAQRATIARLGAQNIGVVAGQLRARYPAYDWQHLLLVGHSMGGDSSALFAGENENRVRALITLDNRRAPLPRSAATKVLSIRAGDTEADPGVLPGDDERRQFGTCLVKISGSRHNDMQDAGSAQLKAKITHAIALFLGPGKGATPAYGCDVDSALTQAPHH